MDTFEITPEPRRPIPLCSVCIKSDFETEEILVSSKGCPTCGMVLKGLSLVTNITDVTRIILDFDKEMFVSCWHQNGDVIWYEFYVSETDTKRIPWSLTSRDVPVSILERLNLAKSWVANCQQNHSSCPPMSYQLPKRVLIVDESEVAVRLVEPSVESGLYVALSYCWGSSGTNITTTNLNLEERMQAIPSIILPKTILDAIQITRHLGFRYLWVDAFCIIQDDKADWEEQAPLMSDVYSKAALVIAAQSSDNAHSGCLFTDERRLDTLAKFTTLVEGRQTTISVRMRKWSIGACPAHGNQYLARTSLEKRGWTLQESLLAERTLHCTASELAWSCVQDACCECSSITQEPYESLSEFKQLIGWRDHSRPGNLEHVHSLWRRVVGDFTSRILTFADDKLAAISGLATALARIDPARFPPSSYEFGLWRDDFVLHLLWYAVEPSQSRLARDRAPSWSWASLHSGRILNQVDSRYENLKFGDSMDFHSDVEIVDVKRNFPPLNTFGQGTGRITIKGDLIYSPWNPVTNNFNSDVSLTVGNTVMNMRLDVKDEVNPLIDYYIFILGTVTTVRKDSIDGSGITYQNRVGLLLVKSENDEDFLRVGYASEREYPVESPISLNGKLCCIDLI